MYIEFSKCVELIHSLHGVAVKKVLHVGAHAGEEAEAYAANGVEKIIWFEANNDLIKNLKNNISQFNPQQTIVPLGLFNENKILQFNITNNLQSSSIFDLEKHSSYYPQIKVTQTRDIQCYRLDTLIETQPPLLPWHNFDFINIDTQGAELAILQGMGTHISGASIKGIYLEVNKEMLYKDIPLVGEIDDFLRPFGFHRILSAWTSQGWGDALYLKESSRDV